MNLNRIQSKWAGVLLMVAIGAIGLLMGPLGYIIWMPVWGFGAYIVYWACGAMDAEAVLYEGPSEALKSASWDGDGFGVHCDLCGEPITDSNLQGVDEDGNAYCTAAHKVRGSR